MIITREPINHAQICCGLGGLAKGFNQGYARVGNTEAEMICLGGIDSCPAACRDFERLTGVKATCLDLFDRAQYIDFHGCEPPESWREATTEDIRRAFQYKHPHIAASSFPCKGFSGLLSEKKSRGPRYQALNRLTVRGLWLMLEAYADDPIELYVFENVPRIATRGDFLLEKIRSLFNSFGYVVSPVDERSFYDCGELGELAQSRKRFLMVARHVEKVPPFLYEPPKRPLRAVGEVLGKMPMPGDPIGGPMHSIPRLHWKTWVRLAFVKAGRDWRSLNELRVENGFLKDYLMIPETAWEGSGRLGVTSWDETSGAIAGASRPENGKFSVADPRQEAFQHGFGVTSWDETARPVQGRSAPSNGEFSVADSRFEGESFSQYGVNRWDEPTGVVTSQRSPGQGTFSVADPRPTKEWHHNIFRIVPWTEPRGTITSGDGPSNGSQAVADPRPPSTRPIFRKYFVTEWDSNTGTVIGGHHSEEGAYAVADPRAPEREYQAKKYKVTEWQEPTRTVISGSTTGDGAFAVADPRLELQREKGDNYLTAGHYGVIPWDQPSGAISGAAGHDNGRFNVADPRIESLPTANEKLVAIIRARDDTWHRPFTTLELAALQSLVEAGEMFDLEGNSDSAKRERIGNAVPPAAAKVIASAMAETILLARSGTTFQLSTQPIWVRPVKIALSVKLPLSE